MKTLIIGFMMLINTNAMAVADEAVDAQGLKILTPEGLTHCYQRLKGVQDQMKIVGYTQELLQMNMMWQGFCGARVKSYEKATHLRYDIPAELGFKDTGKIKHYNK